jgi:hypothetical protein
MWAARDDWRAWFAREHFTVAECVKPETPFDHPHIEWSRRHANCIADALGAQGTR